MADEVSRSTNELRFSNEMELNEEEGELMAGATEDVEESQPGPLSLFKDSGFDHRISGLDHLLIHELYQPLELEDGRFSCKICHELCPESTPIFANKNQFASHRYRSHGTFMNLLQCPDTECDQQFSSIIALKKHLQSEKNLPIESHYKHFLSVSEFEIWRTTVEQVTGSRFVLHNRQSQSKRNVMHCFRSEHKTVAGAKSRSRLCRMKKAGSVCPAHITFIENHSGSVDAVYQLFHFGHHNDEDDVRLVNGSSREDFYTQREEAIPMNTIFPVTNRLPKCAAMQYVQLCLVDMPDALYLSARYSQLLVVIDIHSYFIFARPIPNPTSVSDNVHKSHIIRQLIDMFTQFGCPVGFSVCGSSGVLFDSMEAIEEVFNVNMTHVGNITPDIPFLKKSVIDRTIDELGAEDRWPEIVPFFVYAHNNEGGGDKYLKYLSPFEMMFGRRPPHPLDAHEGMEDTHKNVAMHGVRFEEGDSVLVRYFDPDIIAEGPTPPSSQLQESTEYLNGLVAEVDWYGSPYYPYKVFLSRSTEAPNEDCPFIWVSPFDISPTHESIRNSRNIQRRNLAATLLCSCSDESRGEKCILPRAELCSHKMSRACCEKLDTMCEYHSEYNSGGGDSYKRVEGLSRRFLMREKYDKGDESRREEQEKMEKDVRMMRQEVEGEEDEEGGNVDVLIDEREHGDSIMSSPSHISLQSPVKIRSRMDEEEEQLPSTSQLAARTVHRVVIAEKKPAVRGLKRPAEIKEEDDEEINNSPIKKDHRPSSSLAICPSQEYSRSIEESTADRRKSGRVTRPNILYKSFTRH